MDIRQLAEELTGRNRGDEISRASERDAKANGIVIVFSADSQRMKFRGAIDDEIIGTFAFVDTKGLRPSFSQLCDDRDFEGLRDYFARFDNHKEIEAIRGADGCWAYKTEIPHKTFEIIADGKPYCRGIVFALAATRSKNVH